MKLVWVTDAHLNFCDAESRKAFYSSLIPYDGIVISGDISNSKNLVIHISEMSKETSKPIFFVLGNHDYYYSNITTVRKQASNIRGATYLTDSDPIKVGDTYICGVDGWADCKEGDFYNSWVVLNDSNFIDDLKHAAYFGGRPALGMLMTKLSIYDTKLLKRKLDTIVADEEAHSVIIVTHVPPFKEACLYQGKPTNDDFLPFFCNGTLGVMLKRFAKKHPHIDFLVLCGHTHDKAEFRVSPNLVVLCGGAEYKNPVIQKVIEV